MRRSHNYAPHGRYGDGGKVLKDHTAEKKPPPPPKENVTVRAPVTTGETMRDVRKKQMEELGLQDGGVVKPGQRITKGAYRSTENPITDAVRAAKNYAFDAPAKAERARAQPLPDEYATGTRGGK